VVPVQDHIDLGRHATTAWLALTQVAGGALFPSYIGKASIAVWHTADKGGYPIWEYGLIWGYALFPILLILLGGISWLLHSRRKFVAAAIVSAFPASFAFLVGLWVDSL
jgi:hypothetical protein